MSVYMSSRIWREAPYGSTELLVLLACADAANDDGYFWHSVAKLAVKARIRDRAMRKHLAYFVEVGVLTRTERLGRSNVWRLTIPDEWAARLEELNAANAAMEATPDEVPLHSETGVEDTPEDPPTPLHGETGEYAPSDRGTPAPSDSPPCTTVHPTPARWDSQNHHRTINEPSDDPSVNLAHARDEDDDTSPPVDEKPQLREHPLLWRAVVTRLGTSVTASQRANWLDRCRLAECDGSFVLLASSTYARDFVTQRWGNAIEVYLRETARTRGIAFQGLDIVAPTKTPHASYSQHNPTATDESRVTA